MYEWKIHQRDNHAELYYEKGATVGGDKEVGGIPTECILIINL